MSLCLACGAANPLDTKFCSQCRAKLLIQERYRALRVIGQGGFGKTFLAQDEGKPSKPRCVIKQFIYDDPATLREAQRLFEQEAVRLDDLGKHPQIPELLAHCEQDGRQYLVQEYIDGDNLLQELNQQGKFSEAKIKDLLLDLLPVLQFVHAGNVIHRDIKPENVIRRRSDGKLVLVDFGAAKVASRTALAKTGTTIGSAEYTAPEQARGKAVFASDIYALGVTCIYLLTQISPFDLFSDHEDQWVWRDFLDGNIVNNGLGVAIDKMLEKGLARRYQTVAEMLAMLQPNVNVNNPFSNQSKPKSSNTPITSIQPSRQVILESHPKTISNSNLVAVDCGNGVKIELVRVESGFFQMGSNQFNAEKPVHKVRLNGFLIARYVTTQQQWQSVMGNNPSYFKGLNFPVEQVSCNDARNFCQTLSSKIKLTVRLPTEAEWEYSARGGNKSQGYQYAGSNTLDEVGWYRNNALSSTHPVGQKKPNELGIYDMSGNIWEICLDEWHDNYLYKPERAKQNGNEVWGDWNHNRSCVLRGGSWFFHDNGCRLSYRNGGNADIKGNRYGFRVVIC